MTSSFFFPLRTQIILRRETVFQSFDLLNSTLSFSKLFSEGGKGKSHDLRPMIYSWSYLKIRRKGKKRRNWNKFAEIFLFWFIYFNLSEWSDVEGKGGKKLLWCTFPGAECLTESGGAIAKYEKMFISRRKSRKIHLSGVELFHFSSHFYELSGNINT